MIMENEGSKFLIYSKDSISKRNLDLWFDYKKNVSYHCKTLLDFL